MFEITHVWFAAPFFLSQGSFWESFASFPRPRPSGGSKSEAATEKVRCFTLEEASIAMTNGPFIGELPIKSSDFT